MREADIQIVGEADTGEDAVRLARELGPSVIVMDCAMPGIDGQSATRRVREFDPDVSMTDF